MTISYEVVNVGSAPNSKDGDTARAAFRKVNNNFEKIFNTISPTSFSSISSSTNLIDGSGSYLVNSAQQSFSIIFPSDPTIGSSFTFFDERGTFQLNPVTLIFNGQRLNGQVIASLLLNEAFKSYSFTYIGETAGWISK
jgi:hypothetical protein